MTFLRATALGGVGRFGRNSLLLEIVDDNVLQGSVVIDCGVRFLGDEGHGFDVGLPDFRPLKALSPRLDAVLVTHGHEDHIGALPYLAREHPAPIYATPFTQRLITRRFKRLWPRQDANELPQQIPVDLGGSERIGPFDVAWLPVSHSIPQASCLVVKTPVGTVVHSGDFRIDPAPLLGAHTDIDGLTHAGDDGVQILFADSTGAGVAGDNPGEASVIPALTDRFVAAEGRVFVATFGSQLSRLYAVAEACRKSGRKLALAGRSLDDTVRFAREVGESGLDDVLIHRSDLWGHHPKNTVVAVTGAQAEPNATLARLARGEDSRVPMSEGDVVLFSARVIPGNELKIAALVDKLTQRGVEVVFDRALHVSGHGSQGDLETLLAATRPAHFVAVHGNVHHLARHRSLFAGAGLSESSVHAMTDGKSILLHDDGRMTFDESGRSHEPFALDRHIENNPGPLVAARRTMRTGGVLVAQVDRENKRLSLVCEAITNPPSDAALESIAERAANAFLRDAHPEEVGDDETVDDALRRFLSSRLADAGAGTPYVALVDIGGVS